jgi:hypothetical protein
LWKETVALLQRTPDDRLLALGLLLLVAYLPIAHRHGAEPAPARDCAPTPAPAGGGGEETRGWSRGIASLSVLFDLLCRALLWGSVSPPTEKAVGPDKPLVGHVAAPYRSV